MAIIRKEAVSPHNHIVRRFIAIVIRKDSFYPMRNTIPNESGVQHHGLIEAASDAMVVITAAGEIVLVNRKAELKFGFCHEELVGLQITAIISQGVAERLIADGTRSAAEALAQQIGTGIELLAQRKDGSEFPIEIILSTLESDDGVLTAAAIRDISARKVAKLKPGNFPAQDGGVQVVPTRKLRVLVLDDDRAVVDTICALASLIGLEAWGETSPDPFLEHAATWEPDFLILDLLMPERDGVEIIRALAAQGTRASLILTSGIGGAVLNAARATAIQRGLKVGGVISKPMTREDLRLVIESVPTDVPSANYVDNDSAVTVSDLRHALDRAEIGLVYQPQIACLGGDLVGFEVPARWHHPERGLIMPDRFIPLAESSGLIAPLTEMIVARALEFASAQLAATSIGLSINLSMLNLKDLAIADRITAQCRELGVKPDHITFELTETGAMEDPASTLDVLTRLRLKGFRLSIDDFGTGYSSMVQLVHLPFTEIKIDRSFVASAQVSVESREVVRSVVALGIELGLEIVAEGIEDAGMLAHVADLGCDRAQGYYIGMPLRAGEIAAWQESWKTRGPQAEAGSKPVAS
ncbi:MAG: EAL domain-containing protein [Roseovarius sp.]